MTQQTDHYDSSKWEIVDWREPEPGEQYISSYNDQIITSNERFGGMRAIVRPRVRDFAWVLGEMVRHPLREYEYGGARYRWNADDRCIEFWGDAYDKWTLTSSFPPKGVASTDWRALPEEPASAEPLTLESLAARVAKLEVGKVGK